MSVSAVHSELVVVNKVEKDFSRLWFFIARQRVTSILCGWEGCMVTLNKHCFLNQELYITPYLEL